MTRVLQCTLAEVVALPLAGSLVASFPLAGRSLPTPRATASAAGRLAARFAAAPVDAG